MNIHPPKHLSRTAKQWWRKLRTEYDISDEGGIIILQTAMEAFDRMNSARKEIERDGMIISDRFGQKKVNPLCSVERDGRAQLLQALRQLNFDIEPLKDSVGRPGGAY